MEVIKPIQQTETTLRYLHDNSWKRKARKRLKWLAANKIFQYSIKVWMSHELSKPIKISQVCQSQNNSKKWEPNSVWDL